MLLIAILSTIVWSDGWRTVLTDEPCLNQNHIEWLKAESKIQPLAAWNKLGRKTIEACYVDDRGLIIVIDEESVRIKATLSEYQIN
jgi:hypothetical protein